MQLADSRFSKGDSDSGRGAPGAQEQGTPAREPDAGLLTSHDHSVPVGVISAQRGALDDDGVYRPGDMSARVQLVHERDHRPLVRHSDVETSKLQGGCASHRRRQVTGVYVQADVGIVQTICREGSVVHYRAQAVACRLADQGQKLRLSADHICILARSSIFHKHDDYYRWRASPTSHPIPE